MQGKTLIKKLSLTGLLSYGEWQEITLEPLNVLIGPNASGKSNLIEVLRLLQAAPSDMTLPIRLGGGFAEWMWKGQQADALATIEAIVDYAPGVEQSLRHYMSFKLPSSRLAIAKEEIADHKISEDDSERDISFYYNSQSGEVLAGAIQVNESGEVAFGRIKRKLTAEEVKTDQSILSQLTDRYSYPEISYLAHNFAAIKLYTDWDLGRIAALRRPQKVDDPNDFLLEDASNLALVLNDLLYRGYRVGLIEDLQKLYDEINDIITRVEGGTIQLFLQEKGHQRPISAARLSDGTLRYLCLLAILRHPKPPPLICIEEPELGLHPDVLPTIAELLIDASERTQLIVTTHSDVLISALPEPEMVLVCERDERGSHLQRLSAESLKAWLEQYTLGDLWRMGEIGGTRW